MMVSKATIVPRTADVEVMAIVNQVDPHVHSQCDTRFAPIIILWQSSGNHDRDYDSYP